MGTVFTIYLYAADRAEANAVFEVAFDEVERLDQTLSNYRPSSELSRINRLAAREPVTTDPEVFGLLQSALGFSARTHGAFDITVGPLMRAWGFFRGEGRLPTDAELQAAQEKIGFDKVLLDPSRRTVSFAIPGVELDLGAIGKGYAVDRVAEVLHEAGVKSALIDSGSSTVHALGAPPESEGWKVQVPDARNRRQTLSTILLRDQSLSTSGSYEQCFEIDGRRYCHVMDPRTGWPVEHVLQATLVAADSTTTDAMSNAIFVLGPEKGREALTQIPGAQAVWVLEGGADVSQFQWPSLGTRPLATSLNPG
ncbi:MAG: FAD:protein FMN transferase [Acidobacteria bacterium]|nr:FAD:protein FMN transferase [Acidobacteriota bacterium]